GNLATANKTDLPSIIDKEEQMLTAVFTGFDKIKNGETRLLELRTRRAEDSVNTARNTLLIGIGVLMAVVLMLVSNVVKTIKSRYKAGLRLQASIDELARVNADTEEKNWLLAGVSHITNNLQDSKSVSDLCSKILHQIVGFNQLPGGAVYLYDTELKKLKLVAGYSIPEMKKLTIAVGDGVIGSAAAQKGLYLVKDVPKEYWQFKSASGFGAAGEIICLPLWLNNELKAVIELASFGSFSSQEKRLLEMVAEGLAVSIETKTNADNVSKLLSQVQFQKEFLEHQQQAMKKTNEELQRQAQILQSSEEELKVQEEELRQINAELEERNEAIEIARQTLSQKARELEAASRYKSEFLANMSHELRTPLNSILILAKLMSENKQQNLSDKQVEYTKIIHKSGADLLNLINDILDLSKIEAGKVEVELAKTELNSITDNMRNTFEALSIDKGISFIIDKAPNISNVVYTDQQRIEQIIKNLLSNAFKFTPKGGSVTLQLAYTQLPDTKVASLKNSQNILQIAVKDTGIGIPKEKQQLIFEAFQQADGTTSRKYGGTGLGLSISKELIKMLGGEMRLESEDKKGSTFSLFISADAVEIADKTEPSATPILVPDYAPADEEVGDLFLLDEQQVTLQTSIADDRNNLLPNDKVMLIVEDDAMFARILNDFSKSKGYKTIVAMQGDEGLLYAKKYKPSAIVLDMQLPVIDGWNIIKHLKKDEELKDIPVHIISAADEAKLASGGALAYLKKPVEKDDLEKAFSLISKHVKTPIKQVLILSGSHLSDDILKKLIDDRHFQVECTYAKNTIIAAELAKDQLFDCIIADISGSTQKGIENIKQLQQSPTLQGKPVIAYLDEDISEADEQQLKKVSQVIIRESSVSKDRLMDELELFLYKVQQKEHQTNTPTALNTVANVASPSGANDAQLKGKRVLVVDDDMRNVFVLTTLLEENEVEVITAYDGLEALEVLKTDRKIDMVLMDIMMPEMDGYEATRKIRSDLNMLQIPIIALTAKAMSGDREKCLEAGASDYMSKPLDNNKLLSLMRVWLSQ
ncbi:MAG: response regulator, partial [Bacteroidetes bacterium]